MCRVKQDWAQASSTGRRDVKGPGTCFPADTHALLLSAHNGTPLLRYGVQAPRRPHAQRIVEKSGSRPTTRSSAAPKAASRANFPVCGLRQLACRYARGFFGRLCLPLALHMTSHCPLTKAVIGNACCLSPQSSVYGGLFCM